jgi:hypothetical protein
MAAESSTRIETKFKKFWPDMVFQVPDGKFVTEYPVYFYNTEKDLWTEGETPLDEQWLTSGGRPTDPATRLENRKVPTKEQSLTDVFSFKEWDNKDVF